MEVTEKMRTGEEDKMKMAISKVKIGVVLVEIGVVLVVTNKFLVFGEHFFLINRKTVQSCKISLLNYFQNKNSGVAKRTKRDTCQFLTPSNAWSSSNTN